MTTLTINFFSFGAMHERKEDAGQFHLMEHLLTHGIRKHLDKMQTNGVELIGFTSNEKVTFGLQGLTSRVKVLAEEFFDSFFKQKPVTKEVFENEKHIVLNEYNMGYANPIQRTVKNAFRKHFSYYNPIGRKESITAFSYEDYIGLMEEFKEPVVLNIGPEDFFNLEMSTNEAMSRARLVATEDSGFELEPAPENPQKCLIWLMKQPITDSRKATTINMVMQILSDGLNSPMIQEVREKRGFAYGLGGTTMSVYDSLGYYIALTDHPSETKDIMEDIMSNPEKWISPERFRIISESMKVAEEKNQIFLYDHAEEVIRTKMGLVVNDQNVASITFEDVIEAAKEITPDKFFLYQE